MYRDCISTVIDRRWLTEIGLYMGTNLNSTTTNFIFGVPGTQNQHWLCRCFVAGEGIFHYCKRGIYLVKYAQMMCYIVWVYKTGILEHKHYPDSQIVRLLRLQINRLIRVWKTPALFEVALENSGASKTDKVAPAFGCQRGAQNLSDLGNTHYKRSVCNEYYRVPISFAHLFEAFPSQN